MVRGITLRASLLIMALLLGGCATPSFDIGLADRTVRPDKAAENIAATRNREVAWGGVIVATKNLKDTTQFEILAYPLGDDNRPNQESAPIGRFIAIHSGYLETADYAPGRFITTVGTLIETRTGTIGEAKYIYPLLATSRIYLWPKSYPNPFRPSIHFGIGIGIIR